MKALSFQPCVPIVIHRRSCESVEDIGMNELVEWRPDSSMLVVAVSTIVFSKKCARSLVFSDHWRIRFTD